LGYLAYFPMKLELLRRWLTDVCTIGELYVNGEFECFTLEDVVREQKIHSRTAIPAGEYQVVITPSARFKKDLPLLLNVPNFSGIRIHPGNTAADTEGCILVGTKKFENRIGESRVAFSLLLPKIREALKDGGTVAINVKGVAA
jgi:hypothetical protein